jgi:glyoxylase-like metal-dependent hydrolase (beta-lactamase superfamily II)
MPGFKSAAMLAVVLVLPPTAAAQTPRDIVARGVGAVGGADALRAIRATSSELYGTTFALGQEETPESQARANVSIARFTTDYAGTRQASTTEARNPAGASVRQRRVTAGGIGMLETDGRQTPDNPGAVGNVLTNMRRVPTRLLLAALDNPGTLSALPARTFRAAAHDGVRYASGPDTLNLYFDRNSGLLTVLETVTDDPILGDRRTEIWMTRWQDAGAGVRYPRQLDTYWNGRLQTHSVITAVTMNPPTPDSLFAIPDSIAQRAQRPNPTPTPTPLVVNLVELAPGVWRAEGGTHHSLVVDQGARLLVIEAPQTSARSQAVLDTLRSRFPNKPVGTVVNTHHHWDHSGGVRGYAAAGIPVVTYRGNVNFVQGVARATKTVAPDALSRGGNRPARILAVEDSLVLGEGSSRVVVYRLPTAHVQGLLAAYIPSAGLLFQSDVLGPPALPPVGAAEVVAFVRARGLRVERVAGGHGTAVASWADVERAATPTP